MYHLEVLRLRRHIIIHLPRLNMDLFTKLNIIHAVVLQPRYIRVRFWCGETLSLTHKERRCDLVTPKSKSFQFKMIKSSLPKVLPKWNPSLQLLHKTIQNLSCSAIDKSTKVYNSSYFKQTTKKREVLRKCESSESYWWMTEHTTAEVYLSCFTKHSSGGQFSFSSCKVFLGPHISPFYLQQKQ